MSGLTSITMHYVASIKVHKREFAGNLSSVGFTTYNLVIEDQFGHTLEISLFDQDGSLAQNDLVIPPPESP